MQEIESLILESDMNQADVIYFGDLNIWVDDIMNNDGQNFLRSLSNFSFFNLVNKRTFNSGSHLRFGYNKKLSLTCEKFNRWYYK